MDKELHSSVDAARAAADQHRRRAGELFAEHRRDGNDEVLSQARQENAKADEWEKKAESLKRDSENQRENPQAANDTFSKDGEAAESSERRAWFAPGSVADDKLLQVEEAQQGSLMGELAKYAIRSVTDKDHRAFEGAKLAGKAVAAPVKGVARAGRAAGTAAAKGVEATARGAGATAGAARNTGRAILDAAAKHRSGSRTGPGFDRQGKQPGLDKAGHSDNQRGRSQKTRERKPRSQNRDKEPDR